MTRDACRRTAWIVTRQIISGHRLAEQFESWGRWRVVRAGEWGATLTRCVRAKR